jgi:glutamate synthase (NADPH/NADH) small chain
LRHPVLSQRLPGQQHHPGLERAGLAATSWKDALEVLQSTNNFPEFTGRICPAPCEASCTLNIDDKPVTIKSIECAIVDRGWEEGWIRRSARPQDRQARRRRGLRPGRARLRPAAGARRPLVTVFEKADRIGGLLRYGIPDFKMEKHHIDRRMAPDGGRGRRVPDRRRGRCDMCRLSRCSMATTRSC